MNQFEEKYLNTHVFHDEKSNFTLNFAGFTPLDDLSIFSKYHLAIQNALTSFSEIESGKIVNKTSVKEESENRSVDHYNLRKKEETVKGKSLQHSLQYWEEINGKIFAIRSGKTLTENSAHYTDVIFNGIGGSFLGPLMLIVAMKGADYNFHTHNSLRLHFLSNTDPDSFHLLMSKLDLKTTIMVNMSKSGSTAETKGNMDAFNDLLKKSEIAVGPHNIAITTPKSNFDKFAQENKFLYIFHMNNETGGRTSVGSAIGMVPCAFSGLAFDDFLKGQSYMDELCRRENPLENPAMILGVGIDQMTLLQGRKNMIVLGYSDFLKEFAHYLQQLYMESLGKEYTTNGTPKPEGQTVFGGVGTGEQHAFMQQIQKGINDAFVRFVHFYKRSFDYELNDKSMGRQLLGFVLGTEDALLKNKKSFISSSFEQCDMFNLGMMIALEENIVSILAVFKDINAYDQPGVQDGKLAADRMNLVSLTIESKLKDLESWEGDAFQAKQEWKLDAPIFFIDAVLSDMAGNIHIPNSYKSNKTVVRTWNKGRFTYEISSN